MTCANPAVVRLKGHLGLTKIPCGSCLPCRIARARQWATRLSCEFESANKVGCFLTLTYAQMPALGSLSKEHLCLWLKRLRKALAPTRLRYYAVGEYGAREMYYSRSSRRWERGSARPHYHVLLFGVTVDWERDAFRHGRVFHVHSGPFRETWPYGHVGGGFVVPETIRYVAGYVTDKLTGRQAQEVYEGREPPFARMSQGIGRAWCDAHRDELKRSLGITRDGHREGLPRYFARRIGVSSWDTLPGRLEHAADVYEFHLRLDPSQREKFLQRVGDSYLDFPTVRDSWRQSGLDAEARARLFGPRQKGIL